MTSTSAAIAAAAAALAGDLALFEDYERWCECVRDDNDRALMRRHRRDQAAEMLAVVGQQIHGLGGADQGWIGHHPIAQLQRGHLVFSAFL